MISLAVVVFASIFWLSQPDSPHLTASEDNYRPQNCVDSRNGQGYKTTRQLSSLRNVYYGGEKTLRQLTNLYCMSDSVYQAALARWNKASREDKFVLSEHYQNDILKLIALRDTDNDGILDFRVKEFGGFLANDPDADNDGISNVYDVRPLLANAALDDVSHNDEDGDYLPDHLDWSYKGLHPGKSENLINIQSEIFNDFAIVLNETDLSFTEPAAEMVQDALAVFKDQFDNEESSISHTFKIVTSAQSYDVDPQGVLAEVSPVNGRVNLFALAFEGIQASANTRIAAFTVMIHELTHTIQNAMDYEQNQLALLKHNLHRSPEKFVNMANALGWKMSLKQEQIMTDKAYVDHGAEALGAEEVYGEMDFKKLAADFYDAEDDDTIRKLRKDYKIVTPYSLTDSREWHAEYVTVTLLIHMYDWIKQHHDDIADEVIECAQNSMSDEWGGEPYRYELADQHAVDKIAETLTLTDELLEKISMKYVVEPFSEGC